MKKIIVIVGSILAGALLRYDVSAATQVPVSCPDYHVYFARGSGATRNESAEFHEVEAAAKKIATRYGVTIDVTDLDYPAIDMSSPQRLVGAYVSAGRLFDYGRSVSAGITSLNRELLMETSYCANTQSILVGYSQGASVVGYAALRVYGWFSFALLIGDPHTYLPEGHGFVPDACVGKNLSEYRGYVPYCRTYVGAFGGRVPYESSGMNGRFLLLCNRNDYICGSSWNPLRNSGHTEYAKTGVIGWSMALMAKRVILPDIMKKRARARSLAVNSDEVFAILPIDEYALGTTAVEVMFDASMSFATDDLELNYDWEFSDGVKMSGAKVSRSFSQEGEYSVTLRVSNGAVSDEASARIVVGVRPEERIITRLGRVEMAKEGQNYHLKIDYGDAEYALIKIDGIDLGYVARDTEELIIGDVEEFEAITLTAMAQNGDLGESVEPELVDAILSDLRIEESSDSDTAIIVSEESNSSPILPISVPVSSPNIVAYSDIWQQNSISDYSLNTKQDGIPASEIVKTPERRSGLSFMAKADIVKIILAISSAFGLLMVFILKRRRG